MKDRGFLRIINKHPMKNLSAILLISAILFSACNKQIYSSGFGKEASIPLNGKMINKASKFVIGFDRVISDSRCPPHVQCIWEGEATLAMTLHMAGDHIPFQLATPQNLRDTVINNMRIELIDLLPASPLDKKNSSQYKAVIKVTRTQDAAVIQVVKTQIKT